LGFTSDLLNHSCDLKDGLDMTEQGGRLFTNWHLEVIGGRRENAGEELSGARISL